MSVHGKKLPFGLKNGRMVDVFEVDKGLACGCVCPSCFSPLQANRGAKRQYFSHDPKQRSADCATALETSIHKMAKQILIECGHIKTPELIISESRVIDFNVFEEEEVIERETSTKFDSLAEEVSLGDIRPDVLAYIDGKPFIVEIAVAHFVEDKKKKIIRKLGIPAIEIDLSSFDRLPSKAELYKKVVEGTKDKRWLSNPKAKGVRKGFKQKLKDLADKALKLYMKRHSNLIRIPPKVSQQIELTTTSAPKPVTDRWLRCEACMTVFKKALEDAPLEIVTIECPKCGFSVSAASSATGRLPITL